MNRSGSITVTWEGYIESGQYYWSYRFKINGSAGTTYFYTQNRSTSVGTHTYNSYSVNVNVNHGDTVDLEFTPANGGGTPQTGTGQDLYIRNFRIKVTSERPPESSTKPPTKTNQPGARNGSPPSTSCPQLTPSRSRRICWWPSSDRWIPAAPPAGTRATSSAKWPRPSA